MLAQLVELLRKLPEPARTLGRCVSIGAAWGGAVAVVLPVELVTDPAGMACGAVAGLGIWLLVPSASSTT